MSSSTQHLRQGLPRIRGGGPWPPLSFPMNSAEMPSAGGPKTTPEDAVVTAQTSRTESPQGLAFRRGLPRTAGGAPWPVIAAETEIPQADQIHAAPEASAKAPAKSVPEVAPSIIEPAHPTVSTSREHEPVAEVTPEPAGLAAAVPEPLAQQNPEVSSSQALSGSNVAGVLAVARGPRILRILAIIAGVVALFGLIVLAARGLTTFPSVANFLERYPGEYHPAAAVEPGFPAWARWTHYLNFFFMVLIVRSGLIVRHQQKPTAFYVPKRGGKKVSIYLWLHTSLDVLWMANGIVFVVLLFATGHWVRIVPTSVEVFPNAVSALLQYTMLDWPTENGWVNYNSLQQIMYFLVVFVAAPLAILSGLRMSSWWPERASRLNRLYPAPLARAIHFPVMLFFVVFAVIHVTLILTTGALRNLNHMFVGIDASGWLGFWVCALGMAIVGVGWAVTRPLMMAPVAQLFGRVSNR